MFTAWLSLKSSIKLVCSSLTLVFDEDTILFPKSIEDLAVWVAFIKSSSLMLYFLIYNPYALTGTTKHEKETKKRLISYGHQRIPVV